MTGSDSANISDTKSIIGGGGDEDPDEMAKLERKQSVGSSSLFGSSTSHQHIKSFVSLSNVSVTMSLSSWTRFEPVADALQGLKFITTKSGDERDDWTAVKKRFDELTASTNGLLHYSNFGECIGIKGDTTKFIDELFWTVARKHKINGEYINKKQMKKLWHQIYDESFGSRLNFL